MANKEIAYEYTEEQYSSRSEMSRSLGFQVSDLMWKKVIDYRSLFNRPVNLKWFSNKDTFVCLYPTLATKTKQIETKIVNTANDFSTYSSLNQNGETTKTAIYVESLQQLAKFKNIQYSKSDITKLIERDNPYNNDEDYLLNYYNALLLIEDKYHNDINEDFINEIFVTLNGGKELTYIYNRKTNDNINSYSVISRVYDRAPSEMIEPMMNSLFSFVASNDLTTLEKALIAESYILLIKPFELYNEEMAVLIAKAILAHGQMKNFVNLVVFENLINIKPEQLKRINQDSQQYGDLTYALNKAVSFLEISANEVNNLINNINIKVVQDDFYKIDEVEEAPSIDNEKEIEQEVTLTENSNETIVATNQNSDLNEENETIIDQQNEQGEILSDEKLNNLIEENQKDINENVDINSDEISEEPKEDKLHKNEEKLVDVVNKPSEEKQEGIACKVLISSLDEPTAKRLEKQLLESDVFIKKGEAYFYARHCTLGMFYTIEQYKKANRCVYETARTSMEHLVKLGYYSKQQVGKKFVYTPIERN